MPVLIKAKYERFAQELAKGKTADEAYVLAGYRQHRPNAARLSANEHIRRRVAEILDKSAVRAEVASLLAEAEEVRAAAFAAGQFAPAIAAIKEKGVLSGVRVEKRETGIRNMNEMTDDELAVIASGGGGPVALPSSGTKKPH